MYNLNEVIGLKKNFQTSSFVFFGPRPEFCCAKPPKTRKE